MRTIVVPARAGILVAALALAGCSTGSAPSAAAPTSAAAATPAPPTPTAVPPSVAPASSEATPAGWERIEVADAGFSIALPSGWEAADFTSGDLEKMVEMLGDDPQLEAFGDQLPALMASGIALWAISLDAESLASGFATNLNVLVEDPMPASFDTYVAANVSFVENTFGVEVEQEAIGLPAGDGSRLAYEPTFEGTGTYRVTQYVVTDGDRALIATFSRAIGEPFEALEADFLDIMETVAFIP